MSSESERHGIWNELFSLEADGVRIAPGPTEGDLAIDLVQGHIRYAVVDDGVTHVDFVRKGALQVLYDQNTRQAGEIAELKDKLAQLRQMMFGVSSERSIHPPETETPAAEPPKEDDAPSSNVIDLPKERAARAAGRKPLPAHLPRKIRPYNASSCPCCQGSSLHPIGKEVTELLDIVPVRFEVIQHVRATYRCKHCEKVFTAEGPKHLIEKSSYASAGFMAHVAVNKYQDGLPFYRQEAIFERAGLSVSRTTLANLMNGFVDKAWPVMALLREELLRQVVIHADETPIQVLKEPGRKPTTKSWLWLYRSREGEPHQIVLFDYQQTRSGDHPRRFLDIGGKRLFLRYLQVDAYAGYNSVADMIRVGCMVHVRRRFAEIIKALPKQACNTPAHHALELIGKLYGIERRIKGLPDRIRYRVRQEESVPILGEFMAWLDDMQPKVTPGSPLGKAIAYAVDQWSAVSRYVEDGRLAIDNNIAEREIKSVVIGRKNWLFADSVDGGHTNAVMYSLILTAKANGIEPYEYLRYVIETMPTLKTAAEVHRLLPWNMPQSTAADDRAAA